MGMTREEDLIDVLEAVIDEMADDDESLDEEIREQSPLPDSAIEAMSSEEKREYLNSLEDDGEERANTYTEEIEIPAPGQQEGSTTVEVERKGRVNSYEDMLEFEKRTRGYLSGAPEQARANSSQNDGSDDLDIPQAGSGGDDDE
jgi:hypothetical protein